MRTESWPSARLVAVILVMVVAETAWALYCAETSFNLLGFYVVLVAASAVFWIPGLPGRRGSAAPAARPGIPETNK
jgi:hypothetical protein